MCYRPLKFINPTRRVCECSRVKISVPCGECAECHAHKVSDAHVRSHAEMLDCLDSHGFLWFDTLTYNEDYLPHISDYVDIEGHEDFSCFDNKHLTDALKRLRKRFNYKIRFMIVPEYGSDDRFTHRPHYHCIFFVYAPISESVRFGDALSEAWYYGFTDWSNPFSKFSGCVSHFVISSQVNASRATAYISKYCSKAYSFLTVIKDRLKFVNEIDKSVYRKVMPRRRFSIGFGLSALIRYADTVLSDNKLSYYDGDTTVAVHLNSYYVRHLYQVLCKDSVGRKIWRYKCDPDTYDFLIRRCEQSVQKSIEDYDFLLKNVLTYAAQSDVLKRLGNRTLRDLAIYDNFFRNRLYFNVPGNFNVTDFIDSQLNDTTFIHHVSDGDYGLIDCYLLSSCPISFDDAVHDYMFRDKVISERHNNVVALSLRDLPVLDSEYFPEWQYFDYILDLFAHFKKRFGSQFDASERLMSNFNNNLKNGSTKTL